MIHIFLLLFSGVLELNAKDIEYIQVLSKSNFNFFLFQTLYLASMLIKALWNNALAAKAQLSKQSSFASLLNTNIPIGNKKG